MSQTIDPAPFIGMTAPNAASFIVTIYGDAVEPRGGVLWMGNLIEVCGGFRISESLVRTAVSRLVSAGQLSGEREGRRSYYRLTDAARREYAAASGILFAEEPRATDFRIVFGVEEKSEALLKELGFAVAGPSTWIGPDRLYPEIEGVTFSARFEKGPGAAAPNFFYETWDLGSFAGQYDTFLDRFGPLQEQIRAGYVLKPSDALHLRFALVHAYRAILLRDPRLPADVLPENWPGTSAFRLFSDLYLSLSEIADPYISSAFRDSEGFLPAQSEAVQNRLARLAGA